MTKPARVLKVAFPLAKPPEFYDPASIVSANDAQVIRNIYGRLVEYDNEGRLVSGLAERFTWRGKEIHFELRRDIKTIDGVSITPKDAALSLKRLIVKNNNVHGDLGNLLCPQNRPTSLKDDCPGISFTDESLVLQPADESRKSFLIPLLASLDFSIIPESSFSKSEKALPIKDYRNTSGPYYIDRFADQKTLILKANPFSFHYSDRIPQEIHLTYSLEPVTERLLQKEVDMILPVEAMGLVELHKLAASVEGGANLFSTLPIKVWQVRFTQKAVSRLNPQTRMHLGQAIKEAYLKGFSEQGLEPTIELFPSLGEGGLNAQQKAEVQSLITRSISQQSNSTISLGVSPLYFDRFKGVFAGVPNVHVVSLQKAPWTLPPDQQPDCYIAFIDSAFYEDVSLIGYNIKLGTFGLAYEDGLRWLNEYMAVESKEERMTRLRQLHFNTLINAYVFPIGQEPYSTLVRKPWSIHFSKLYAGTPFWQLSNN